MFIHIKTIIKPLCERLNHPLRIESEPVLTGGPFKEQVTEDHCRICEKNVETHKYVII